MKSQRQKNRTSKALYRSKKSNSIHPQALGSARVSSLAEQIIKAQQEEEESSQSNNSHEDSEEDTSQSMDEDLDEDKTSSSEDTSSSKFK